MQVQLIVKPGPGVTGISRYTEHLYYGLIASGLDARLAHPATALPWPPLQSGLERLGLDVNTFLSSYPLRVAVGPADLYHLTTQTLASLLLTQRFRRPVVVTVHDIIPYLVRHDPALNTLHHSLDASFYRLSLAGIKRADGLLAVSEYTRRTLIEALGLPAHKIHVVYPHMDLTLFHPQPVPDSFLAKYGLNRDAEYVLYVGTNDPRKNLPTVVQALAILRARGRNVKLLRIGADPFAREKALVQRLIARWDMQQHIIFFAGVSDADLALFYNVGRLLAFPSFYEGFGIPVVEAMASGTPVVCSPAASLREVAGDAAQFVDPHSANALALAMEQVLDDQALREHLRAQGIQQARKFANGDMLQRIREVYQSLV
ncbi:MAG: glycosyltransferase family 4 protein [Chloroflexi bacterium]|nr:glycosyltransferase family 4 protein [Chloroflexota bacterium]